ncbi:MAG: 2Fe-2S iron-sulfur cluster-binding protein [Polyangiaceae bacterium]|jgi:ferredoxin
MPTVVFEREKGKSGKPVIVVVPEGGALVDTCDDNNAPVPFSCKSASCGTCRIEILEGADELLPPADEELDVLDLFHMEAPGYRLACQAKMKPGLATLRVRAVDD